MNALNNENGRATLFAKLLIVAAVAGAGVFGLKAFRDAHPEMVAKVTTAANATKPEPREPGVIRVGVVTWGGYAGGEYFNNGFKASENSRYFTKYGLKVQFVLNDDYASSRDAWKADQVDVLWTTVDSFPTEVGGYGRFNPKLIFQADWSRGGDAIVSRRGINSVNDLKGMKIAAAYGTPSHTFLLWMLDAADMKPSDITLVQTDSAVAAAQMFKAGKVDAAVVWSPDDQDCVKTVAGSKILKNTKEASNIIADGFFVKDEYLQAHKTELRELFEGWMIGAAEINSNPQAAAKAAEILAQGLNISPAEAAKAISNARLATLGDNQVFFGLAQGNGVTGESIYNKMSDLYTQVGVVTTKLPDWRQIYDSSLISGTTLPGAENLAEGAKTFTAPTQSAVTAPAFATKRVTITFPTGSAKLDENSKYLISAKFGDVAKGFSHSRVRIEGNTDSTGSTEVNKQLSLARAKAVASFLAQEYHFDHNRFVVVGNGPDKPVSDNQSPDGRAKNRRTDFELISE
jgi:NitT/TauT family transport system substrate-binding protein